MLRKMRSFCSSPLFTLTLLALCIWGVSGVAKSFCKDRDKRVTCLSWRNEGYCENTTYTDYMTQNCNLTCGHCREFARQHNCNPERQFPCLDGYPLCVSIMKFCDGVKDCEDGHDETDCPVEPTTLAVSTYSTGTRHEAHETDSINEEEKSVNSSVKIIQMIDEAGTTPMPTLPDPGFDCPGNHYLCRKDRVCVRSDFWCDGWIEDCSDGEDERPDFCYREPNKEFIRETYKSKDTPVVEFLTSLLKMKHTHCLERSFSCRGACSNFHPNLISTECACDKDCFLRQDCCHDVIAQCDYKRPEGILEECIPNLFGKNKNKTALVVAKCPKIASELHSRLCDQGNDNENMKFYGAPVYSTSTQKHYKNYYCARCNGAPNKSLKPWNVWYDCNTTEETSSDNCTSLLFIPQDDPLKTCTINKFVMPSFDESVITVSQRNGLSVSRCHETYAPVSYNNSLYRNPYCVFLHRAQLGDYNKTRLYSCDTTLPERSCPLGSSTCRPTFSCIVQDKVCDGKPDCPDGSDEPRTCSKSIQNKLDSIRKLESFYKYLSNPPMTKIIMR